jgi:hypothetical protein
MAAVGLPADGEISLGPVRLPTGRRVIGEDAGEPVAWVTEQAISAPGRVWSALREVHAETGLIPVLLDPWDSREDFYFFGDVDPGEIDYMDPLGVLAGRWRNADHMEGTKPALAPAEDLRLPAAELLAALDALRPAHIGLVPAARPADVLAAAGWTGFNDLLAQRNGVWLGSVLRSFEDRFGAVLLKIGPSGRLQLLVERPPRTLEAARKLAAEHKAFSDELANIGPAPIAEIAAVILNAPVWSFWWD